MIFTDKIPELLSTMDVPHNRRNDWKWLVRNLGIRNSNHPNYKTVMQLLINRLLAEK